MYLILRMLRYKTMVCRLKSIQAIIRYLTRIHFDLNWHLSQSEMRWPQLTLQTHLQQKQEKC